MAKINAVGLLQALPLRRLPKPLLAVVFLLALSLVGFNLGLVAAFFTLGFLGADSMPIAIAVFGICWAALSLYGLVGALRMFAAWRQMRLDQVDKPTTLSAGS